MTKAGRTHYVCQSCGNSQSKWAGQCPACGGWNTLVEETASSSPTSPQSARLKGGRKVVFEPLQAPSADFKRLKTGLSEFDRVCGGGLVTGSALLIGGDPGIGKSTLLLQVAALVARQQRVAYLSGEEALEQIRLRATRLGVETAPLSLATATNVRDILSTMESPDAPQVLIIDSIQTMYVDTLDSAPGTVAQVRAAAGELIHVAKKRGITLFLVGHVTKDGMIAGPKVLEHMVDTVLYFEGDRGHAFRLLRAVKNRFGPVNEIGVFDMQENGLHEVKNPSALFLPADRTEISGSVIFAGVEGTRPLLVEIQALAAPSPYGTPRRTVVGWDANRLAMIMAVLETRGGVQFGMTDVYLNVAGGLRITEPAADLAVAAALLSSVLNIALPPHSVVFGEIGLSGELRAVGMSDTRLKEAEKLGFTHAVCPPAREGMSPSLDKLEIHALRDVYDLLSYVRAAKELTFSPRTEINKIKAS